MLRSTISVVLILVFYLLIDIHAVNDHSLNHAERNDADDIHKSRSGNVGTHSIASVFNSESLQSRRRVQDCAIDKSLVAYFDIGIQVEPTVQTTCPLADQVLLGNDINNLLQRYGYGDQRDSEVQYFAGVCSTPTLPSTNTTTTRHRNLQCKCWVWKGTAYCIKTTCGTDNSDMRLRARNLQSSWFFDTYKYKLQSDLQNALSTEIVKSHLLCLGVNPKITVNVIGKTLSQIQGIQCNTSLGFLDSVSLSTTNLPLVSVLPSYGKCVKLDFSKSGNGTALPKGAYVTRNWKDKYGITVTASGFNGTGYTPSKMARIFDTRFPTDDPDLGSPNSKCPVPGPGIGTGGEPGKTGANCVPVGNVLIVQEDNSAEPDDNAYGGTITFQFDKPVFINDVGVMDIQHDEQTMTFTYSNGGHEAFKYRGFGDNAVQRVISNKRGVIKLDVFFKSSGAVTELNFCPSLL